MHRIARPAVFLAALFAVLTAAGSTASAVTWHNAGATTFTATSGPTTLSSTGVVLTCSSTDVAGTLPSLFAGATLSASGSAQFTGCSVGGVTSTVHCGYTMTGTSWTAGTTSGTVDATCRTSQFGTVICLTEGSIAGSYANPSGSAGKATLNASSTLRSTIGASACPLGNNDPLTFVTTTTFTVTNGAPSATGPSITRTP